MRKSYKLLVAVATLLTTSFYGQTDSTATTDASEDLFEMSLEDLMDIEVTSVSKKAERLQDVASSIYVLTQEDIERSGATTIHELLREVPGYWGVQDEFNNVTSNTRFSPAQNGGVGTVLYLLDGTPIQDLMSSTFSNRNFDIPLDEIDRIEVIKGSGGVIYGANSATGVVNIFTKKAEDYDGINVRADGAYPGYANATVRAGGKITDNLSVSGYGKMRYMEGYGLMPEFEGDQVTVPKNDGSGDTTVTNAFTENFEKSLAFAAGLKLNYKLSEKSKISLNTHYNTMEKGYYTNYYPTVGFGQVDSKVYKEARHNRIVSNIRFDHKISDNHSFFVRASQNYEDDYQRVGGGYSVSNGIIDLEIQDNLSLGINNLSFGANYRAVSFNIKDINDPETINYVDPNASESLIGFFLQDKINVIEDKFDLLVGAKGETYSLVNDKWYFSPMAKASVRPTDKVTIWGGFTQSYSTPGFNQTNIDLNLLRTPVSPLLPDSVYRVSVQNGSSTVPTRFQTAELGLKAKIAQKFQVEANGFYTWVKDGVSATDNSVGVFESPTMPGTYAEYYYYGNYLEGNVFGSETFVRYRPKKELMLELSHTWLKSDWQYQENDDFDVTAMTDEQRDRNTTDSEGEKLNQTPEHIIRLRGWYEFAEVYYVSGSAAYASRFRNSSTYQYPQQRYAPILGGGGTTVGNDSDRFILNLKVGRSFADEKLDVYLFGNDVTNSGVIAQTNALSGTTLSQIGGMYGIGANLKIK